MGMMVGESEYKLRTTFDSASRNAPSVIFIDEIDSIAPNREKVGMQTNALPSILGNKSQI